MITPTNYHTNTLTHTKFLEWNMLSVNVLSHIKH